MGDVDVAWCYFWLFMIKFSWICEKVVRCEHSSVKRSHYPISFNLHHYICSKALHGYIHPPSISLLVSTSPNSPQQQE